MYDIKLSVEQSSLFISNNNVKRCFSQFRISSYLLEIELSRYNNIGRNERKCKLCNNIMVESENSSCYAVQFIL